MSKKRKSFIVHNDSLDVLDDLTNEQAGMLFKAIKSYQLGDDFELDTLTKIAFSPFKNQFERDSIKYENLCEKNRLIAESRYSTKSTSGKTGNQSLPQGTKSTDNDSKSDSKNKSDSDTKDPSRFAEFWDLYAKKTDSKKCEAKFNKLPRGEIDLIFENLPGYIRSTPDKQYRKGPYSWLTGKCWNDEIQLPTNEKPTHDFSKQNYRSGNF